MSRYTTKIIDLVKYYNNYDDIPISSQIENSLPYIFNFNYPIWSETYRRTLEKKIILRYFNKEIGLETIALWQIYLEERLNSIMPYYNELYKTVSKDYDWLSDINLKETFEGNKKVIENVKDNFIGDGSITATNTNNSNVNEEVSGNNTKTQKSLKSDLPQATLNGLDYGSESIEDESLDNRLDNRTSTATQNDTSSSSNNTNSNNTKDLNSNVDDLYSRIKTGLTGNRTLTELNMQYRDSLINIDNMIVNELKDLFMMIY